MMALRAAFVLIALGIPALLAPILVRRGRGLSVQVRTFLAFIVCLVPSTAPLACDPANHPGTTFLIAILGGIVTLKAIDWLSNPRHEDQHLRVRLALAFWPALQIEDVGVRIDRTDRRMSLAAPRLSAGSARLVVGLALTAAGQALDLPARGIWLDSSLKAFEIYALAGGANDLMVAALALAGYRAADAWRYPILARSVLDFWSRYNVCIHRWLKHHTFEPIGRRGRRPNLGILAVFAVSGLLHDYLVVVAMPELIGRQFAFFGLHGLGAIAGAWLGRRYRAIAGRRVPRALAIAATLGFILLTAPIFIRCVDRFIDLHRDVGGWLLKLRGLDRSTIATLLDLI
jgi:MBOAT, membrane-bound O-acyltransferase family